jgi:hypothetical protein
MRLTGALALTAASAALPAVLAAPGNDHLMGSRIRIKREDAVETPKVNSASLNAVFDTEGAHLALKILAG